MFQPKPVKTDKKFIEITQENFAKGYVSTLSDRRIPPDGLAEMVNMWLEQDSVPRIRPPFKPYGDAYLGPCHGADKFTKIVDGAPQYWEISMQNIAVNAQQTVSITGSPTGGTFTLTYGGYTTTALAYNISAANLALALEALTSIGTGNVSCTGGTLPGTAIVVTFQGTLANEAITTMTTAHTLTGGTSPASAVSSTTTGGPVATVCVRKDGGAWSQVTSGSPVYDLDAWANFCPGSAINTSGVEDSRVYISNGITNMSYYDIPSGAIVQYASLSAPAGLAADLTGETGSNYTEYYVVTANGPGGESIQSSTVSITTLDPRGYWSGATVALSWDAVSGASSYSIYTGDVSSQMYWLVTVNGLTFTDDGSQATNVYKLAPVANSSAGPTVSILVNVDDALYGVGDPNNPSYMWYSGVGQHFGDFSSQAGAGSYIAIDYGGETLPTVPFAFQDGKGNPVVSILTYGQAGRGKLYHFTTQQQTIDGTVLTIPDLYQASSKDGSPCPRAVSIYENNAYYCTGLNFKTTGIKPDVINILSTDTIANQLIPDLQNLTLSALGGACSQEYLGKIYFGLPVGGSTTNNQMWILDMTRGGLWILQWPVSVTAMWIYEDNSGVPHFLTLQNGLCLELDLLRLATPSQDNGVAFSTSLTSGAMTFDKGGSAMFSSYYTYFNFLYPVGDINVSIAGLDEDNVNEPVLIASGVVDSNGTIDSRVAYGQMLYSNPSALLPTTYSGNVGPIIETATAFYPLPIEVDDIVNQQTWTIETSTANCDYLLSSVVTTGYTIPMLYAGQ